MSISNKKDAPEEERTDDPVVIANNFTKYYEELYSTKGIHMPTLDKLIKKLTLKLNEQHRKILNAEISATELIKIVVETPLNKSPGSDKLPYECWKADPTRAAEALARVGRHVSTTAIQPQSWTDILVAVLPKVQDAFSTHLYRPISLLNADYKNIMRAWANRLGPILAELVGHHQRGFIPGRDGRENIINVQLIIDLLNAKTEEGAVLFLDQEKAFDMVSLTTINRIFQKLEWPESFRNVLKATYTADRMKGRVVINGIVAEEHFKVNSGTRQGCPLSPLIFAVVADLFNMAVITSNNFTGHHTVDGIFVKISAYADDTAVHVASQRDIAITMRFLRRYSWATGGRTNFNKSEGVKTGPWRHQDINLGVKVAECSKYLGIITGNRSTVTQKAIRDREAKVYRQLEHWDNRVSSAPTDRVFIAKLMCLSLIWYHSPIVPGWEGALLRIQNRVHDFIWRGGIHKVANDTLRWTKDMGGLNVWNLEDKAAAFRNVWVIKYLTGNLNPLLASTIKAITELYMHKARVQVPLWESRVDHSANIAKLVASPLLAALQRTWATVVRRDPVFSAGDRIMYSNAETKGNTLSDRMFEGVGQTKTPKEPEELTVLTYWYDLIKGNLRFSGEWNLVNKLTYHAAPGKDGKPCPILSSPNELYIVTGYEEDGTKIKTRLDAISIEEEDPKPHELGGPEFVKKELNAKSYAALSARNKPPKAKMNKWVELYGVSLKHLHNTYNKIWAHSKIKGFMWTLISHALPVRTRMWGDDDKDCNRCGNTPEDIRHLLLGCKWASKIWLTVLKEWWTRTGDPFITFAANSFKYLILDPKRDTVVEEARNTLVSITAYHIWTDRCNVMYRGEKSPPYQVTANNIWREMDNTIQARIKHLHNKMAWWKYRLKANLVPNKVALDSIKLLGDTINGILPIASLSATPDYLHNKVKELRADMLKTQSEWDKFRPKQLSPSTHKWRLTHLPERAGTLDDLRAETQAVLETQNSASESGD